MSEQLFVYGAGGFAREVAWLIDSSENSSFEVLGFIDDNESHPEDWQDPRPIMNFEQSRIKAPDAGYVVGIGSPEMRKQVTVRLVDAGVPLPTVAHSGVQISERISFGEGCIVCAGNILTVDIKIESHVHINLDCTIGHDVVIGEYTTISPGVHISGNVTIEPDVFLGTGACIVNGSVTKPLIIGRGSVIGAGAVVTKSADAYTLYAGVPAIAKKKLR